MTGGAKQGTPILALPEPGETRDVGFDESHQQQHEHIPEEDESLSVPYAILSCQKHVGQEMGE